MLPLWQRGDALVQALGALHAIAEDSEADWAEHYDMTDAFEGFGGHMSRSIRAETEHFQSGH
ncbi:hypothetical protein [Streptomyces sp. NPDC008121]|uniref:hypothetical protein n=1 Tax=Streptomyces sp. NPDC008121 TaxID=3364809 RepID=UPI0036E9448B